MGNQHSADESAEAHSEFAMPFTTQLVEVTKRVFEQYWRTPGNLLNYFRCYYAKIVPLGYIYSKLLLGVTSALFIGFSFFHADSSVQGLQDVIFSVFLLCSIFTSLVQQVRALDMHVKTGADLLDNAEIRNPERSI